MRVARYDGAWTDFPGRPLHQFTSLTGASAGTSWTARAGDDLAAKWQQTEERFALAGCPACGARVRVSGLVRACVRGCGWETVGRAA